VAPHVQQNEPHKRLLTAGAPRGQEGGAHARTEGSVRQDAEDRAVGAGVQRLGVRCEVRKAALHLQVKLQL